MTWERPAPADLWRAIEAYLAVAYDGPRPAAVEERLSKVRQANGTELYECGAFECADDHRYALRLGNRFYPHMKLVVEASPAGGALFRADTHDRHFLDLVGPGQTEFEVLMARNETIAKAIEDAWAACQVPTTREYWRATMASRRAVRPS
ncbi:MAG: hypothetical protein ACJ79R_00405 [Anaeromyxobacteraceae bacterium]